MLPFWIRSIPEHHQARRTRAIPQLKAWAQRLVSLLLSSTSGCVLLYGSQPVTSWSSSGIRCVQLWHTNLGASPDQKVAPEVIQHAFEGIAGRAW